MLAIGHHPSLYSLTLCAALACATAPGCSSSFSPEQEQALFALELRDVQPRTVVPGTAWEIQGRSFVDRVWGASRVVFEGMTTGAAGAQEVRVVVDAKFIDFDHMEVNVDEAVLDAFGADGDFVGFATVEVDSTVDGETYRSVPVMMNLRLQSELMPIIGSVQTGGLAFVNDKIQVSGDGFLLGGSEGETVARVEGCFQLGGSGPCETISETDIPLIPESEFDRTRGTFAFSPRIAGIEPGDFEGTVILENRHAAGATIMSTDSRDINYTLTEPRVFAVSPLDVSLGQYLDLSGGGFLGGGEGDTIIELNGTYTAEGAEPVPVAGLLLIPEFVDGQTVRYVMNEQDELGQAIDLRSDTGVFSGTIEPITTYQGTEVRGDSAQFSVNLDHIKQVIYLVFRAPYVESLRHFGLRAVDRQIRERIESVVSRDYRTVNVEVRTEKPTDFALYSEVELNGPDPNGRGLLGYDNTPGKDIGNDRLYDKIGGVNAETQENDYPGYGGVFIESFFAFSKHPGDFASSNPLSDDLFDDLFDEFRPDRGGKAVTAEDINGDISALENGASCPGSSRSEKLSCAIFAMGNMIGSTLSHEIGHSLGLAKPFSPEGFHNSSDSPNRLMDSGGNRPFTERVEMLGDGPGSFCDTAYDYLRQILPTDEAPDTTSRPSCF